MTALNGVDPEFMGSFATRQFSHRPPQVPITCGTGNCTFAEPYKSIGYRSSCWDISDQLVCKSLSHETNGNVRMPLLLS